MPGIITNIHLAHQAERRLSPEVLLGTAMPSFLDMYRDNRDELVLPGELMAVPEYEKGLSINRSIQAHQSRNGAYVAQLEFTAEDLAAHMPSRFDRAHASLCARLGLDMLYDNYLLETRAGQSVRDIVADSIVGRRTLLSEIGQSRLGYFIEAYFRDEHWAKYEDNKKIAMLIREQISGRRQRGIHLNPETVDAMAEVLADQRGIISKAGGGVLQITLQSLRAENISDRAEGRG